MEDDEREKMNVKVASKIRLNLLDEVIHNVIDKESIHIDEIGKKLINKLYVKVQLYGLQMNENANLLEYMNLTWLSLNY